MSAEVTPDNVRTKLHDLALIKEAVSDGLRHPPIRVPEQMSEVGARAFDQMLLLRAANERGLLPAFFDATRERLTRSDWAYVDQIERLTHYFANAEERPQYVEVLVATPLSSERPKTEILQRLNTAARVDVARDVFTNGRGEEFIDPNFAPIRAGAIAQKFVTDAVARVAIAAESLRFQLLDSALVMPGSTVRSALESTDVDRIRHSLLEDPLPVDRGGRFGFLGQRAALRQEISCARGLAQAVRPYLAQAEAAEADPKALVPMGARTLSDLSAFH